MLSEYLTNEEAMEEDDPAFLPTATKGKDWSPV